MKNLIYLSVCCLFFCCKIFAGEGDTWQNIKKLAAENQISIYDDNFREKIIPIIFNEKKNLNLTFSRLLYMGNIAYLNGDNKSIKMVWACLKRIVKQKNLENLGDPEKTVDFIFKHLPKKLQKSKEESLSLFDFVNKKAQIVLVLKLLHQEASLLEKESKQKHAILLLYQNFLAKAKTYATL